MKPFERFLAPRTGGGVAAPNVNNGLFGSGVQSGYKYTQVGHDTGDDDVRHFHPHYLDVNSVFTR